jgi:peptide deformylase
MTTEPLANPIQNPIITAMDRERWPLLEAESSLCAIPLCNEDEEAIKLMDALLDVMDDKAAGLAAVQVGYPRRIFLLRNGKLDGKPFNNVYINPIIKEQSKETAKDYEACLSLPNMHAIIHRPKRVTIEYYGIDGQFHEETFTGFWARAVMHEMDHLNGSLLIHHMQKNAASEIARTSFGMKITPEKKKEIARRRVNNKRARKARKNLRRN